MCVCIRKETLTATERKEGIVCIGFVVLDGERDGLVGWGGKWFAAYPAKTGAVLTALTP
jgi:hypothetical protein